jgi:hypothetical protein
VRRPPTSAGVRRDRCVAVAFGPMFHIACFGGAVLVETGPIAPLRIKLDAVRRISNQQFRLVLAQQSRHGLRARRISAKDPVLPQKPQVAQPRCGDVRERRGFFCSLLVHRVAQQRVEFVHVETGQAEVEPKSAQIGKLRPEQVFVPRGLLVGAIVRQAEPSNLGWCQVARHVHGYLRQAERLRRLPPQVPNHDPLRRGHALRTRLSVGAPRSSQHVPPVPTSGCAVIQALTASGLVKLS